MVHMERSTSATINRVRARVKATSSYRAHSRREYNQLEETTQVEWTGDLHLNYHHAVYMDMYV